MAVTRQQKEEILKGLVDKFSKSKSVVFAEYKGIGVHPMSDLRRRLRKANAECKVGKKTLMRLAADEAKFKGLNDDMMKGTVAATFVYTEDFGAFKVLYMFSKENEKLKILGGVIGGKVVGFDEIKQLALVPSREESLARMMGSLLSPLSGFVRLLDAYKRKLEAGAPKAEPPAAPEAPVAAPAAA